MVWQYAFYTKDILHPHKGCWMWKCLTKMVVYTLSNKQTLATINIATVEENHTVNWQNYFAFLFFVCLWVWERDGESEKKNCFKACLKWKQNIEQTHTQNKHSAYHKVLLNSQLCFIYYLLDEPKSSLPFRSSSTQEEDNKIYLTALVSTWISHLLFSTSRNIHTFYFQFKKNNQKIFVRNL